ncbi:MAG TPA: type II toxin-antitoxin system VapC family toxin [Kiritimatiellia bacterium]|nr:type II toxin-antitoxin system VapC family toxin [Kiritimatiellia bacterium]
MTYFDTSYLVRLYWSDQGYEAVRNLAERVPDVVCGWHGRVELLAAFHRKFREGVATQDMLSSLIQQFRLDEIEGGFTWLALTDRVMERVENVFSELPRDVYLRSADATHLACAAEYGLTAIYSHDRHLLAAAPCFGLRGINVIG